MSAVRDASHAESVVPEGLVRHVVGTIVEHCNPERIVLFGSAAHGQWERGSDLDLLVVMESKLPRHRRAVPLKLLFSPYPCPLDILVYTPEEVKRWAGTPNHIITEALETGKVVHERSQS